MNRKLTCGSSPSPARIRIIVRAVFLKIEDHVVGIWTSSYRIGTFLMVKPASNIPKRGAEKKKVEDKVYLIKLMFPRETHRGRLHQSRGSGMGTGM